MASLQGEHFNVIHFPFLNLPGELRNLIYAFLAESEPPILLYWSFNCQPYSNGLALAQTCRRLRYEYLPFRWRTATLYLQWDEVNDFFDTFYPPDAQHVLTPAYPPPRGLAILVGAFHNDDSHALELLPFIKLSLCTATLCCFDVEKGPFAFDRERLYALQDSFVVSFFLDRNAPRWRSDVEAARIASVQWRRVYRGAWAWEQHVVVRFHKGMGPPGYDAVEPNGCPTYLAETVFAPLEDADWVAFRERCLCSFVVC